jgi:hypothetical protein
MAAIDSARTAAVEALKGAPLGFRRILFVADTPGGFAIYDPRPDNVFKPGEPLIVYTEPVGIAWQQAGDKVSSKLVVDFELRSPEGLRRIHLHGTRAADRLHGACDHQSDRSPCRRLHSRPYRARCE